LGCCCLYRKVGATSQIVIDVTRLARWRINTLPMQKTYFVLAGAIAFVAMLGFAATPAGMAPLPPQYLHGGRFHSADKWFQIDVPAGWEWFEMRAFDGKADPRWPDAVNQSVAWMARDPKSLDDVVIMETYMPGGDIITGAYAADFESRTRKAVQPDVMSEFTSEPLMISGERSFHYRYKVTGKNRAPLYRFGYATGMEHKVFVSTSDKNPEEPKWLRPIALSVRWLIEP
jgi:hypothetical protein